MLVQFVEVGGGCHSDISLANRCRVVHQTGKRVVLAVEQELYMGMIK